MLELLGMIRENFAIFVTLAGRIYYNWSRVIIWGWITWNWFSGGIICNSLQKSWSGICGAHEGEEGTLWHTFVVARLTHWGRVMNICVRKLTIIGSDNGLLHGWHQAIIWTNAGILLIRTFGTNFSEILGKIN